MLDRLRWNRTVSTEKRSDGELLLVVGLGNPGRRYQGTRHNVGFAAIDRVYARLPRGSSRRRFQAEYVETTHAGRRILLVKPETFMNDSGIALGQIARWHNVPPDNILLVYDELDLPLGTIRLRPGGSAGGHNGVASIISHLRTHEIPRLRIGIGRPQSGATISYVLANFSEPERRQLPDVLERAADAALAWIEKGTILAMNEHNRRASPATEGTSAGS
ncbi:MAG TPA: aminoacyl-tRNA hydrolase [Thermomicrobiales bacterium]|nr:aminoacyl-tRNA hydrolase [Thermomicrobiales bacterium]